jgi:hypothetical protein
MSAGAAARPSDADPAIAAHGQGDVAAAVVSMSSRHADGLDAEYLEWHVLDHLPEQHRLTGMRLGQRWVSTPACRAARAASAPPFDAVDHVVQYLFAEPVDEALAQFFPLGGALRAAGRMPLGLPRVQVGGWTLAATVAAERVLVGGAVVPWRPASGVYVIVERHPAGQAARALDGLDDLVAAAGVAGAWCWVGGRPRHPYLDATDDLALVVAYLDEPPLAVAAVLGEVAAQRGDGDDVELLLAAPFELVVPGQWHAHLP